MERESSCKQMKKSGEEAQARKKDWFSPLEIAEVAIVDAPQ